MIFPSVEIRSWAGFFFFQGLQRTGLIFNTVVKTFKGTGETSVLLQSPLFYDLYVYDVRMRRIIFPFYVELEFIQILIIYRNALCWKVEFLGMAQSISIPQSTIDSDVFAAKAQSFPNRYNCKYIPCPTDTTATPTSSMAHSGTVECLKQHKEI